jgi:hypothetical protein
MLSSSCFFKKYAKSFSNGKSAEVTNLPEFAPNAEASFQLPDAVETVFVVSSHLPLNSSRAFADK